MGAIRGPDPYRSGFAGTDPIRPLPPARRLTLPPQTDSPFGTEGRSLSIKELVM